MTQLDDVLHLVRRVLGDDVIGAYPHGSAVLDGLRPSSDLDVLVVTRGRTAQDERRALVDGLMPLSGARAGGGPARPVELTVVAQDGVRPWRYPPCCGFLYGEWLRDDFERGVVRGPPPLRTWRRSSRWRCGATRPCSARRLPRSSRPCRTRTCAAPSSTASRTSWTSWRPTPVTSF